MVYGFLVKFMEEKSSTEEPSNAANATGKDFQPHGNFHIFFSPDGNDEKKPERIKYITKLVEKHFNFRLSINVLHPLFLMFVSIGDFALKTHHYRIPTFQKRVYFMLLKAIVKTKKPKNCLQERKERSFGNKSEGENNSKQ